MKTNPRHTWIITLLIIVLLISSNSVFAESMLLDAKINTDTGTSDQKQPAIAMNRYGYTVVAWTDKRNGESGRIYAQIVGAKGLPIKDNFMVDDVAGSVIQQKPDVAMDDFGNFVIVWEDTRDGVDIRAKRFYANGAPKGDAFRVNEATANTHTQASVAMDSMGYFVVSWDDTRNGHPDIYAQYYSFHGNPIGENLQVNTTSGYTRGNSDVAISNNGGFIITWIDGCNGGVGDIYMQMYDPRGDPIGGNREVSKHTGQETSAKHPGIAMHQNGDFLICWQFARVSGADNIYGRLYNRAGSTLRDIYLINETDGGFDHQYPAVSANLAGGYAVVWQTNREGNWNIRGRNLAADGNVVGASVRINDLAGDQQDPHIVVDERGIMLFVWRDDRNGNDDIYGTWSGTINPAQIVPLDLYAGSNFDSMVPLNWNPVYADFPKVSLYHIYRSVNSGGPYMKVATVDMTARSEVNRHLCDWIDWDVENDRTYYYVVTAEASGLESLYSNEASGTPCADSLALQSRWAETTPVIDANPHLEWGDAQNYLIDDPEVFGYVSLSIKNNADFLYICTYDRNNHTLDANDMVNILFDTNNDGEWDAAVPSSEGIITVMSSTAGFTGLRGSYPNGLGYDAPILSPVGIESAMDTYYSGIPEIRTESVCCEIAINLHTSPLRAIPGQTIGFGIWVDDPGNFYSSPYGFSGEFPWGLLRESAATLGDLTLATPTDVAEHATDSTHPKAFTLHQNYPNPFNPVTTIRYELPAASSVRLVVYNVNGQLVKTLVDETESAGVHSVTWNGRSNDGSALPGGMYVCRMVASGNVFLRKMVLMK